MTGSFSLLFLCTGNRFRSPLAASFVGRLTDGLPVVVASAGLLDVDGSPALAEATRLAASCGISLSAHRARRLQREHLQDVDLLLGFEQIHVSHAVVELGGARERAFTLPELVRLLGEIEPVGPELTLVERARERVRRAAERRAAAPPAWSDEIADPFGQSSWVARQAAAEIQRLSIELAAVLFDVAGSDGLVVPEERSAG
jgi:protein-tyrosine phosphatase